MFSMRLRLLPSATKLRRLCFTGVCVQSGGGGLPGPGGGCLLPGAWGVCLVPGGGLVLGGCLLQEDAGLGGCLLLGGGLVSQHALRQTLPRERRPLLRTVRIILECILVNNDLFPNEVRKISSENLNLQELSDNTDRCDPPVIPWMEIVVFICICPHKRGPTVYHVHSSIYVQLVLSILTVRSSGVPL